MECSKSNERIQRNTGEERWTDRSCFSLFNKLCSFFSSVSSVAMVFLCKALTTINQCRSVHSISATIDSCRLKLNLHNAEYQCILIIIINITVITNVHTAQTHPIVPILFLPGSRTFQVKHKLVSGPPLLLTHLCTRCVCVRVRP